MWRIQIINMDGSEVTFKGNELDIDYDLAAYYFNHFVTDMTCTATYQQYPIRENRKMNLEDKLEQLRTQALLKQQRRMQPNGGLGTGYAVRLSVDVFVGGNDLSRFVQKSTMKKVNDALENAGIVVLDSEFGEDVSMEYESSHPEIIWTRALETKDEIYYLHKNGVEHGLKMYSKIGCREYKGIHLKNSLCELATSINNGVIVPLFVDKELINDSFKEELIK